MRTGISKENEFYLNALTIFAYITLFYWNGIEFVYGVRFFLYALDA